MVHRYARRDGPASQDNAFLLTFRRFPLPSSCRLRLVARREVDSGGVLSGLQTSGRTQRCEFEYQFPPLQFPPLHSPCVMSLVMNVTFGAASVSSELASEVYLRRVCDCMHVQLC